MSRGGSSNNSSNSNTKGKCVSPCQWLLASYPLEPAAGTRCSKDAALQELGVLTQWKAVVVKAITATLALW